LTARALRWLEVDDSGRLTADPGLRYARFSLLRVGSLSATAAHLGQNLERRSGGGIARRARLQVTGELELHGVRFPYTAPLAVTFEWKESPPPGAPPAELEIVSTAPIAIDLVTHGIVPRDARGEVIAEELAELRKPPANEAQVTVRWRARLVASAVATPESR
jgi:hypothetical protein